MALDDASRRKLEKRLQKKPDKMWQLALEEIDRLNALVENLEEQLEHKDRDIMHLEIGLARAHSEAGHN